MADVCDDAQVFEARFLAESLSAVLRKPIGKQRIIGGVICCVDCDEPICSARLRAVPGCCRCRECEEDA